MISCAANTRDDDDADDGGGAQLLTVPRSQFLTADDMEQADCIETLASDEDEHCLQQTTRRNYECCNSLEPDLLMVCK